MKSKLFYEFLRTAKIIRSKPDEKTIHCISNVMIGGGEIVFQSLEHRLVKKDDRLDCQRFCIDVDTAIKVFKKTDQLVSFEVNDAKCNIKIGIFSYEIEQHQNTIEDIIDLGSNHFSMEGKTSICYLPPNNSLYNASKFVSTDELRLAMNHVRVDKEMIVATNAHYLWFDRHNSDVQESFYVSPEVARIINDSDVTFKVPVQKEKELFKPNVQCYSSGYEIIYKMPDAKYPTYDAAILKEFDKTLVFGRKEMINAIEGLIPFSNQTTNKGELHLSENGIIFSTKNIDYEEKAKVNLSDIGASFNGDPIVIGFNIKLMLHCLKVLDASCVSMTMSQPNKACVMGEKVLLMPIMLGN